MALSGRKRSAKYRSASTAASTRALSDMRTPWCSSYFSRKPRKIEIDLLEAALQRGVLLHVLPVLVQSGGPYALQLAPAQHGLQQVAGIDCTTSSATTCSYHGVELINEQDDLPVGIGDLLDHGLQPILELAPELGTCDQGAHIQADYGPTLQCLWDVPLHDALCKSLRDGCLAHSRLSNENWVVFGAARENLNASANFIVPADHRVELARASHLGQVLAVALERFVFGVRILVGDVLPSTQLSCRYLQLVGRKVKGP
eukprot:scaffold4252_cov376-Prasinococcus_capsulatus_cf.AAC.3